MKRTQSHYSALFFMLAWVLSLFFLSSCKTKAELRREQDVERMKQDLTSVKSDRADFENLSEELKGEIARLSNLIEQREVQSKQQLEEVRREMAQLQQRLQTVEGQAATVAAEQQSVRDAEKAAEKNKSTEKVKATFELGKKYFDEGKFDDASEIFKLVSREKDRPEDAKKALFWLAESDFASKEFASAAIQFAEFKKSYPKDVLVAQAIYRQANAFKNMNKPKEAKLFYQELLDKFPKSNWAKKVKAEMKKSK